MDLLQNQTIVWKTRQLCESTLSDLTCFEILLFTSACTTIAEEKKMLKIMVENDSIIIMIIIMFIYRALFKIHFKSSSQRQQNETEYS